MFRRSSVFIPAAGRIPPKFDFLYRFHNAGDPDSLLPPVMLTSSKQRRDDATAQLKARVDEFDSANPEFKQFLINEHAFGDADYYPRSPFVSTTTSPESLAQSRDRWAKTIAEQASHLSIARVRIADIFHPTIDLSKEEGEVLTMGSSFQEGLMDTKANPFRRQSTPPDEGNPFNP